MMYCASGEMPVISLPQKLRLRLVRAREYMAFLLGEKREENVLPQEKVNQRAAELLDRFGDSVLRCAYMYLRNMADAEDSLQDTLIQYLRVRPALESEAHEKAWLLRVAANLSKNRLRYNRLRKTDELAEDLAAEQKEDLAFVWEAVSSLPEHQREAVHLFYQEGYSTAEIGQILRRRESTVRSDLRRGREKLKDILKEVYDFDETL